MASTARLEGAKHCNRLTRQVNTHAPIQKPPRGRPKVTLDNQRVQRFMWGTLSLRELLTTYSRIEDVFTGVVNAQSAGQGNNRPLSKRKLYAALRSCPVISTETVTTALARITRGVPSKATVGRYAVMARIASQAIDNLLELNPHWIKEDLIDWGGSYWTPDIEASDQPQ